MKKNISNKLHIVLFEILRGLIHVLYFIPICKNRILFSSYIGEAYSCNPRYLSEFIQQNYPREYELVWFFKDVDKFADIEGIKSVRYKSFKWFIYEITSKVKVVNNSAVWIPRRKGQLIIDTWHGGGCYKKVAVDNKNSSELANYRTKISGREVNLYLSSSKYFSDNVVRNSFMYEGDILACGMPRNDILFEDGDVCSKADLRNIIAKKYSFESQKYIVLFAPTWRKGTQRMEQLDIIALRKSIEKRFDREVVILGRGHHTEESILEKDVIDVTNYPDMQELLVAVDMLITDYSSSMWDFSFTGKPCFLFTPDLETYSVNPGFDCDIHSWGFPVCESNQILVSAIEEFDEEKYQQKMKKHHDNLNNYENGHACERVCEYIREFCRCN